MPSPHPPTLRSRGLVIAPLLRYLGRLRFKTLFLLTASLFAIDLLVPDVIPLLDELLLGLATLLFATWRKRKFGGQADDRPS